MKIPVWSSSSPNNDIFLSFCVNFWELTKNLNFKVCFSELSVRDVKSLFWKVLFLLHLLLKSESSSFVEILSCKFSNLQWIIQMGLFNGCRRSLWLRNKKWGAYTLQLWSPSENCTNITEIDEVIVVRKLGLRFGLETVLKLQLWFEWCFRKVHLGKVWLQFQQTTCSIKIVAQFGKLWFENWDCGSILQLCYIWES